MTRPARGSHSRGPTARFGLPGLNVRKLRPRVRKRTVALAALLGFIALAAAVWATLRQTAVLRETLEAQLSDRFGAHVTIESVQWDGWSTIVAEGLTLRVPGWLPPSDEVASIRRAVVTFHPIGLLGGHLTLEDMEIDGVTLRVIEMANKPGSFNFLALQPKPSGAGSVSQPRRALLRDLRIELGVLRDKRMEIVSRRAFTCVFEHVPDDPSLYSFELAQTEAEGAPLQGAPIRIFGTWDERTFAYQATLDSLTVGPGIISLLPLQARTWAQRAGLAGRIESARLNGSPADPISFAELRVRDVTFRERDVVRSVPWARMVGTEVTPIRGDVRVRMPDGTLTVRGNRLEIAANDARIMPGAPGSGAVEIPVELRFGLELGSDSTRPFNWDDSEEWLSGALASAPFDVRVKLNGVSALPMADGAPHPVEMPQVLVDALRDFGARDWLADVDLSVARGKPVPAADGALIPPELAIKGRLSLSDGSMQYSVFPYKLDHVKGVITIDGQHAAISELTGHGSGDAVLRINGTLDTVPPDPGYQFQIVGTDVPIDDRLLSSFHGTTERIFNTLLDRRAFASLREAGLGDDSMRPGGKVSFDMRVRHPTGGGETVVVEGRADVHEAQVVLKAFPYPMNVKGSVQLNDESVELVGDGFHATTHTGATGVVRGRINIPRDGDNRRVDTQLEFDFQNERFSPLLLAAIPPSFTGAVEPPPGWPGRVKAPTTQLLEALGAQGSLAFNGSVRTQATGDERVETTVRITDGSASPDERLPRVLRRFGLSWPGMMKLESVSGTLHVAPEGLEVVRLEATRGPGRASAQGSFSPDGERGRLQVDVVGFPLTRDLIDVAQGSDLSAAYQAWDALQPQGSFDGEVLWQREADHSSTTAAARLQKLTLANGQVLQPICGEFVYRDGTVELHDLSLRGVGANNLPITIDADGTIMGAAPDFTAKATGLTLASPLVEAGLIAGGQRGIVDTLHEWHLDGGFDAQLSVGAPAGKNEPWTLQVDPSWLSGVHAGDPFSLRVHSGAIVATNAGVRFDELHAGVMQGWLTLNGTIGPGRDGATDGDLTFALLLARWSPDVEALLPSTTHTALRSIEFDTESPVATDGLRIRFHTPKTGASDVRVNGELQIARGSFRAGTTFTDADGVLDFNLKALSGRTGGAIGLKFAQLSVVDRIATDVSARLIFEPDTNSVRLTDLEAWMYGGRLMGEAHAILGEQYTANVTFANVGFAPFAEATDTPEQRLEAWRQRGSVDGPGRMRGRFQLEGAFERPELQRGMGRISVADARMVEFPLGMSILQLSQLMLPLNASLERADAEFDIHGSVLTFEKFTLASSTLRLEGTGSLSLSDGDLALRFRNRGTLPIVSDLFGAVLGDQIFMIDVQGTLQAPEPKLVPIPILAPEPSLPPATHASAYHSSSNE